MNRPHHVKRRRSPRPASATWRSGSTCSATAWRRSATPFALAGSQSGPYASPPSTASSRACRSRPGRNTAGVAVAALVETVGLDHGFELTIEKGIPLGSGLGGLGGVRGRRSRCRQRAAGEATRQARAAEVRDARRADCQRRAACRQRGAVALRRARAHRRHRRSERQTDSGARRRSLRAGPPPHRAARRASRARCSRPAWRCRM